MADGALPPDVRPSDRVTFLAPTRLLRLSPTDPRNGSGVDLSDLDVGEVGPDGQQIPVRVPLWVRSRPIASFDAGAAFEIIKGGRRWRKAKLTGLPEILCELHDELTDDEVRVLQIVDNLQRRALTPLEEAKAYAGLRDELKLPVAEIAARLHVSQRHVHERLALLQLYPEAQAALREERISLGVAVELSTIAEPKKQAAACKVVEAKTAAEGIRFIRNHYHLRIADGGFDPEDARLVEGAPACSKCTENTAVQRAMFDAPEDAHCLKGECYRAKQAATEKASKPAKPKGGKAAVPKPAVPAQPSLGLTSKIDERAVQCFLSAITAGVSKRKMDASFQRFLVGLAIAGLPSGSDLDALLVHLSLPNEAWLRKAVQNEDEVFLRCLLVELLVAGELARGSLREHLANTDGPLSIVCRYLKIDGAKLLAEAEADVKAERPETKAKRAAKAAKEKPLPTGPAPKRATIPVKVVAFLKEIEAFIEADGVLSREHLADCLAPRAGMVELTPAALMVMGEAIAKGVKRGTLVEEDGFVKLPEKDGER